MATQVKITIIGAGSAQFSAGIVRDLCVCKGLHGSLITLMDIDEKRLDIIQELAQRISDELGAGLKFTKTTDRLKALKGAEFVINTAQVGGHAWDGEQGRMAERHGYYRGSCLGAFGQMNFFLKVAREMEELCPDAWLIQSANPVFEGCTLMHRETGIKVLGLCHGHYGYREIADVLGLDKKYVTAQMPGFNHWIWLTDFRYKGKDAMHLIDEWIETKGEEYWNREITHFGENQMSRGAIHAYRHFGLMPIGDTARCPGWWYHTDLETKKRWYGTLGGFDSEIGWAMYLKELEDGLKKINDAVLDKKTPVTAIFKPEPTDEQIVPIINSLVNDEQAIYQVNIPNSGYIIEGFPQDLVVECQGVVNGAGIRGIKAPPLPRKLMAQAMIPRWKSAELIVEAMRSADKDMILNLLLDDRRTKSLEQAQGLLEEWLSHPLNKELASIFK